MLACIFPTINLTDDEENLAKTIEQFQLSGFPLTIARVCQLAYQYAHVNNLEGFSEEKQSAGRKWLRGFLNRHPNITLKKARNLSIARAMGANPKVIGDWFKLFSEVTKKCGITSPIQIWSGDETGVQNVPKEIKVLGIKNVRTFQQVSSEQGETSTILSIVNAVGNVVPPMVIHKGQRVQDSWKIKAPGNISLSATTKGYITKSKFHEYGIKFVKYLKSNGLANHTNLLIVDGHKSHVYNLPFYELMRANNIEILTIPPHTSHLLQALDSVPFAQFKKYWEQYLRKYNNSHSGRSLNKVDFFDVFAPAWNNAMVPKNIIAGFRRTGIFPYDPKAIPESAMAPSIVTDKENGEKENCSCCVFYFVFCAYCVLKRLLLFTFLQRELVHVVNLMVYLI